MEFACLWLEEKGRDFGVDLLHAAADYREEEVQVVHSLLSARRHVKKKKDERITKVGTGKLANWKVRNDVEKPRNGKEEDKKGN